MRVVALLLAGAIGWTPPIAQRQRPVATLTARVEPAVATAGSKVRLLLRVVLPPDVHVQSNKPLDAALIPTVLTLTPPSSIRVERIIYPAPTSLPQAGRSVPLAVYGPEFTIEVVAVVGRGAQAGKVAVPAELRYQACTDQVCFPPARAVATFAVSVRGARGAEGG